MNRHELVFPDVEGRQEFLAKMRVPANAFPAAAVERMERLIAGSEGCVLPGTVRRAGEDEIPPDCVAIGYSSPFRVEGARIRAAGYVSVARIENVMTPRRVFEAGLAGRGRLCEMLRSISRLDAAHGIGLYGAAAQEIVTGIKCMDAQSDIDLLVAGLSLLQLKEFRRGLIEIEAGFGASCDIEVVLSNGGGVKLDELLANGKTCLVKNIDGVGVLPVSEACELLT